MQSVITKREIPKDLQGVSGLRSGFVIPDVQSIRLTITGQPGAGKSTLLNSNPCLLSLDPERGGDTAADPRAIRFTPPPATDPSVLDQAYLTFVDKLIARKLRGATDIRMIAIDTYDKLISIFQRALCLREGTRDVGDVAGGHGKGYFIVRDAIFGMLDKVYQAGMGWAIIAHTCTKTVEIGGKKKQVSGLAVSDSYKSAVFQECEHMLFVEHGVETIPGRGKEVVLPDGKKIVKPGKSEVRKVRKLKTRPGGLWQGGDTNDVKVRVPLAEEMILPKVGGWDLFAGAYEDATKLLTEGEKNV
jgi:energy-coupling factor transporter ATP-binding protein EcfA2